jgi:hypothetical protein
MNYDQVSISFAHPPPPIDQEELSAPLGQDLVQLIQLALGPVNLLMALPTLI